MLSFRQKISVALLPLLFPAIFFVYGGWIYASAMRENSWIQTSGTIVQSALDSIVDRQATRYVANVSYAYTVASHNFTGNERLFLSEEWIIAHNAFSASYPVGAVLPVFYNPAHPDESVLRLSTKEGAYYFGILGLIIVPLSLWPLVAVLRERRKT